jgi:RNA polymerase sigma-70 factor (ECF subfamily)
MSNDADDFDLEPFRPFLLLLARRGLPPLLRGKLNSSDVVQQTLEVAFRARARFGGRTTAELAAWLRRILAHKLEKACRFWRREKRDVARERSLQDALEQSSSAMGDWLADRRPSPGDEAHRIERALFLAAAIAGLPTAQRQAVQLRYWGGLSLGEIAEQLGKSTAAVAGHLQRGLRNLRQRLRTWGES